MSSQATGLHVAFDGQLALLENSLSRYTRNVLQQLAKLEPQLRLSLLVFSEKCAQALRSEHPWLPSGVELFVLRGKETPYHLNRLETVRRYHLAIPQAVRQLKANIFQGHYKSFPLPIGFKVVTILHDVFQWVPTLGRNRGLLSPLHRLCDRWIYRRAHLVAVSQATLIDFKRYLDARHPSITQIHEGPDPAFSPLLQDSDERVLGGYRLSRGRYLLYIGDLTPRKDVTTLIRAYHKVKDSLHPHYQLAVAKGHWAVCPERDLVAELGLQDSVTFLGHVPDADLPALYRNCQAFVFPSHYEGFGLPPLEAMASGVPVITTNRGALAEVVENAGLTFTPGDVEELAAHIRHLCSSVEVRQALASKSLVQAEKFSWESCARSLLALYARIG